MDSPTPSRATTIDELKERSGRLRSAEGYRRALAFRPRASDVLIATYPKSGTTWMQQIVHGLRSGGSMAFDEITEVVPWIEMAHDLGHDLDAEQGTAPRAFKSHLTWRDIPKGGRTIAIVRDPKQVVVSMFHFLQGWSFEPGTISLDSFVRELLAPGGRGTNYWDHVRSWWPARGRDDVLFLCYETMQADLPGAVARVARFIGLAPSAETLAIATRQATLEFMQQYPTKFDDHLLQEARNASLGLPMGDTAKVRPAGGGGARATLGPDLAGFLDEIWAREIAGPLGLPSYAALRQAIDEAG